MTEYENYDLQESDPYLIPGSTCLINSLGIKETGLLNQAEADISAASMAELVKQPITPTFDLQYLKAIHKHLFGDIYPWAGELRQTEIGKSNHLFLPHKLIESEAKSVFGELHAEACLKNMPIDEFAERAGYYLGKINMIHPFREGNGRTQRILLDQLAEQSGYLFEWEAVSGEQMAQACRKARTGALDSRSLSRLLQLNIRTL